MIGGDLVDAALPDWERQEFRRKRVFKGLENKQAAGVLSDDELKAISLGRLLTTWAVKPRRCSAD